ncbi:YdeI/OmpD-associated family protein [Micromonospora sp. RHAY321]|uniref:YdeI/OmpD-associated family protein n=1 Tax=Micromonospora sp. RHAY321 TaxID=2944807 RepID=UPI00207D04A4|nr:YdeI/OmpD-associated family protein [Micromonospora sp. RHAY321]MCO1597910.1 YdeI/OmpD-associated family protein [Micromonospora sp. RHAY321]
MDVLDFPDAAAWDSWLAAQHEVREDAWLRIAKRHSGLASITISDALDVALCYGWIDGHRKGLDDQSFLQRYSRRRPRSSWSQVNVAKVEALTAAGRMRPAGLAEVAAAKADGRWEAAYEAQRTATVPPDLSAALAGDPRATAAFERLGRTARYAVILPLLKARTPQARSKVLAQAVARLAAAC